MDSRDIKCGPEVTLSWALKDSLHRIHVHLGLPEIATVTRMGIVPK